MSFRKSRNLEPIEITGLSRIKFGGVTDWELLDILLILARDLGYSETNDLMPQVEEVSKLLDAYAKAILNSDS